MRVLFFCENANQVYLCSKLAGAVSFPSSAEYQFICMDWDPETTRWVSQALSTIAPNLSLINLFDEAPASLKTLLKAEKKNRKPYLEDVAFEFLRGEIGKKDVVVVQFNDASQRGEAIAKVCRNTGVARLLIQDGFLNFASKTNNLKGTDQNYKWGHTHPEMIAVWGDEMKDAIIERHHNNPRTITVTGNFREELQIPDAAFYQPRERTLRVLWADQAILDQNKADRGDWLAEFAAIADELKNYDTELRLHPSTKDVNRAALQEAIGDAIVAAPPSRPSITKAELLEFDVVVTYYSTVFLDCLANNVPCVILKTRSLDIELPPIDHPLLSYCSDVSSLGAAVQSAGTKSVDIASSPDIRRFIAGSNGAELTAELIAARSHPVGGRFVSSKRGADTTTLANLKRLQNEKILILGGSFGNHIGVGKPIKIFIEYLAGSSVDIEYQLVTNGDRLNLLSRVANSSIVIINSFDVVRAISEKDLSDLLAIMKLKGGSVVFYCHETRYTYERLLASHGGKVQNFVNNILPHCHCFAVSDQQADWLGSLGARSVRTVYNSIGREFSEVQPSPDASAPVVLMVGTQQKRKGVDLFSRVADIAAEEGRNWKFVWLGAYTKGADGCYKSNAVDWRGHVSAEDVRLSLSTASAFFLSSIDDPMPLSVGEALMCGIPCLVYEDTGFAPFIETHKTGEVFRNYDASSASSKLATLLQNPSSYSTQRDALENIIGIEAFGRRMLVALGEIAIGHQPTFVKRISGSVALHRVTRKVSSKKKSLKMRVLDNLERRLPTFITKPGEKLLRLLGVI
ncbi:glycosyltransferase family 4 protein [Agrobacterium rosae]|uniref:glycosyltransferase family 4 protein n=1 Tax=Agrobacterium rosae TaxID=1972867 RepID=UPI0020342147|nr:glycosyltransferase family 4 protein [Agrobacterium rosae]